MLGIVDCPWRTMNQNPQVAGGSLPPYRVTIKNLVYAFLPLILGGYTSPRYSSCSKLIFRLMARHSSREQNRFSPSAAFGHAQLTAPVSTGHPVDDI